MRSGSLFLPLFHMNLPWDKPGASSSSSSTLHRDETLATANRFRPAPPQAAPGFRTTSRPTPMTHHELDSPFASPSSSRMNTSAFEAPQLRPPAHLAPPEAFGDGGDVAAFLGSTDYTDALHQDELHNPAKSYRHQVDHAHSLAEQAKAKSQTQSSPGFEDLLACEDIVAYLSEVTYTDDVYGAPPQVASLIKEAQQELQNKKDHKHQAIARLQMVRQHLLGQAGGDAARAAQHSRSMRDDDWDQLFRQATF